ncbi:Hypothetical predicted protein [Pelobates cultripes]|uniref:Uncharacterized protein n=1 Tax=Pelobates cultripes TaxID=61616 RepID=A0AAD1SX42_PELCU|nr:Hypothetical predicted protein [Pelobates cultripes]
MLSRDFQRDADASMVLPSSATFCRQRMTFFSEKSWMNLLTARKHFFLKVKEDLTCHLGETRDFVIDPFEKIEPTVLENNS